MNRKDDRPNKPPTFEHGPNRSPAATSDSNLERHQAKDRVMNSAGKNVSISRLNSLFLVIALVWSILILTMTGWDYWQLYGTMLDAMRVSAGQVRDGMALAFWITMQNPARAPSVSLPPASTSERDISPPSHKMLTLNDLSKMLGEDTELEHLSIEAHAHITSLDCIRPENLPDEWEKRALQAFDRGEKEVTSLETVGNKTYMRLMHPLITEAACLECHGAQGYKVGDIRGGISVSLPWERTREELWRQLRVHALTSGGIWAVGILGLLLGRKRFGDHLLERERAEVEKEELEAQTRQLQKAESLGRMAGAIAHHFNNHLTVVMGNLELARDELSRGASPVETLTGAMQAARKASEVSNLMLTYLGQTRGIRERLDLAEVCRQHMPMLQSIMPKSLVVETDLPRVGPVITGNSNQIQQVLTNLFTNAWEAIGKDPGTIHVTVTTVSSSEIPILHRRPVEWQPQDVAYACLEVADSGCGITEKDLEKLFDPFFSTKFTGRGLGLPVVLGIVTAHHGAVTVASEPGQGSTFRVFIPVCEPEVSTQGGALRPVPAVEWTGTVLVAENEPVVRKMVATMLTRLGFTVLEAQDGVEAVEIFRQHQGDIRCVLSDLTMPRMNGWKTLDALRAITPDVVVVMTSGHGEEGMMAGEHAELPDAFLSKPYQVKELREAFGMVLGKRSGAHY